jgi:tRNA threonylcarbamoyladenosine biosynthesis protein TsaB
MRVLAIDASTRWGGAALVSVESGRPTLVAEIGIQTSESHAARLLPAIEGLLAAASWPNTSIDAYAAARGPGSFTGIRVALGLLQGFALASGRPCVGIGTLHAMTEAFGPASADRVPLLDAGRGEVYGARFDPGASPPVELRPAWVGDPAFALSAGADVAIFGHGGVAHEARLREAGYRGVIARGPTGIAAAVGRIALDRLLAGALGSNDLAPLYVRPADAEIKLR